MLKVVNIGKSFSSQTVLDNVSLEIKDGEFFSLLGPSGCGKTTLLRIIAGFETASTGSIYWDDLCIDKIKPQDRPFNMVFQRYALFPHLSVFENVAFGLKVKNVATSTTHDRVKEALELVGLWELRDRLPETLSGGQAQRVAFARAVVNKPKILLLDEPLSALDQKMREHMQTELRELQKRVGITFILVTHDQEEAMALSDRIAVMNKGKVEQISQPEDLYHNPKTLFVAQFIGTSGSLAGQVLRKEGASTTESEIVLSGGQTIRGRGYLNGSVDAVAVIRPEKIRILGQGAPEGVKVSGSDFNRVKGQIHSSVFKGSQREIIVDVHNGQQMKIFLRDSQGVERFLAGAKVELRFATQDTFIYPKSSGNG